MRCPHSLGRVCPMARDATAKHETNSSSGFNQLGSPHDRGQEVIAIATIKAKDSGATMAARASLRTVPSQARGKDKLARALDAADHLMATEGADAITTTR